MPPEKTDVHTNPTGGGSLKKTIRPQGLSYSAWGSGKDLSLHLPGFLYVRASLVCFVLMFLVVETVKSTT
jgi:hypothetical protein